LVKVGRWTAFIALAIAMVAAKPLLGGLDQAFQYIQEYTGFIYPGVVVVFGMGLLWKKATNRAALWTAIFTIPVGIAMKIALPELPFLLRMGYVFMILAALAVTLSLTDKKHFTKADILSGENKKMLTRGGIIFAVIAVICLILGLIYAAPMAYLGFSAIFFFGTLMAFLSVILFTNANSATQDDKAYEFEPELFKTDRGFLFGAMGICVIVIALYAFFW
jgi:solute:Na+ symporter, SSS family